jgi:hypothetical protein
MKKISLSVMPQRLARDATAILAKRDIVPGSDLGSEIATSVLDAWAKNPSVPGQKFYPITRRAQQIVRQKLRKILRVTVYRYPEGVTLNGREYLLAPSGKVRMFASVAAARTLLRRRGLKSFKGLYFQKEFRFGHNHRSRVPSLGKAR